jgi:hypothetical protein
MELNHRAKIYILINDNMSLLFTEGKWKAMSEGKADRRTWLKTVAAAIGGILVGAAAGYYGKPREVLERIITSTVTKTEVRTVTAAVPTPSPTPSPKPEEEMIRWWKEASKPYSGTTIKVLAQAWEPNFYLRDVVGPKFTELTGIKIDWELTSNELVMEKEILDM